MPVLIGMVGVSIDAGALAVARSQLGASADAAALSGAGELARLAYSANSSTALNLFSTAPSSSWITASQTQAIATAARNSVLGHPVQLLTSDVAVGASNGSFTATATGHCDSAHTNGAVPAYFSRLWGSSGTNLTIAGTAVAQPCLVNGFQATGSDASNPNANFLPIALDLKTYNDLINLKTSDHYKYNSTDGTVTAGGSDGFYESARYPIAAGSSGNWGTVNIGVTNSSASILSDQILNGISPAQLATYPNSQITLDQTDSTTSPATKYRWLSGNPGLSAGIEPALTSILGKLRYMPIYDQNTSNGTNATFRVVKFAGVRIMAVNFQANPKFLIIQPAPVKDTTAILRPLTSQTASLWNAGDPILIHLTR